MTSTLTDLHWKMVFKTIDCPSLLLKPGDGSKFEVVSLNNAFTELTGVCEAKLEGRPVGEGFPECTEFEEIQQSLEKVRESGEKEITGVIEWTLQAEERSFYFELNPLKDEAETVLYILLSIKEITLRKKLEKREKQLNEELAIVRQEYRNFVRENPDGLYRLDLQGNFLHANESVARMADLPLDELLKMSFLPFCAPHHKEHILNHFQKAANGEITSFEGDFISATGKTVNLKILLMPMFLDGKVAEVHGISKDVTEIRQTEKVMVEKSRFLEVNAAFISSLLESEINDATLQETFGVIAQTVQADRMYYFGADRDPDNGEILISQKVEWCSDKTIPQIDNLELQNMPIKKVEEITAPLIKNQPFKAGISDLKKGELKSIFIEQDIKSMLLLPIFLGESLYGFVGFDDCTRERKWKEEEVTFLKSLTQNLTNAFEKREALQKVRKREEDLKRSEQKFRALVQEGSDLIAILDTEGYYSFVSENYDNILGFDPKELIGKNSFHFIHPEDWARVKEQFNKLQTQKQVKIAPFRFRNKKGEWKWSQTTVTNLLNDSAVNGIVANSRDITTIIEQAREIEHINERYQLAATATQDLIYDWDILTNEVNRFHRGQQKLFGYPADEVNKKDFWRNHIHPDDFQEEKKLLSQTLSDPKENFIKSAYRFRRADGTYAKVVDKGYIIRDCDGRPLRLIGATSDISDITAKKEALKIANKRFKMAMKATNEMIWDWDIATDSVTRSKGYKKIFGYDTNDATSVHSFWLTKVASADREKVVNSLNKALENCTVKKWKLEYRIIKADGTVAYVSDRGYILRNDFGKATRMVGAVLDVTNSRKLLRRVQRQNEVLKEIAWEQSHLVRAPLARIQGLVDLLEEENADGISREDILELIQNSADELDCIIRSIVKKTEEISPRTN
ncbi:PAS domain S-box protein [Salinimicrobium soli]|uniref:PAS domain S-box protein n=1 Tax=Salinimicrobium soli TaxID=1254399 RepID=UPI003AAB6130